MPGRSITASSFFKQGYQGQPEDEETGFNSFELRLYDARIGGWLSPDPYQQHHSPYMAMSNNPLSFIDPDGGWAGHGDFEGGNDGGNDGLGGHREDSKGNIIPPWAGGSGGSGGLSASFSNYNDFNSMHLGYQSEMSYNNYVSMKSDPRDLLTNGNLAYQGGQVGRVNEYVITTVRGSDNFIIPIYGYEFVPEGGQDDWFSENILGKDPVGDFVDGIPIIGAALSSGRKLESGDYVGATADFGYALVELITLGYGSQYTIPTRMATKGGTTVLGHYPAYTELALKLGANRFQIPTNVWNKMSAVEQWAANTKFLDRMILRGDNIRLATPLSKVKPGSFYQKELNYLFNKGYKVSSDGLFLVK